jgi:hypothetical protein
MNRWTVGQIYRRTETLIRGGLGNHTCCANAGGTFFTVVLVFLLWQEIVVGVTYDLRVQYKMTHRNGSLEGMEDGLINPG